MATVLTRRATATRATDWEPGQYGVLDLDDRQPAGPCAAAAAAGSWLPDVLQALEQEETC